MNNTILTQASVVCNGFNQYLTTVGHHLVDDLVNSNPVSTGGGTYSADTAIAVPLLKVVRLIM